VNSNSPISYNPQNPIFIEMRLHKKKLMQVGENVTKYARDLHEGIDYYREGEEHGSGCVK
jgi:hypothetical protein